MPPIPQWLRDAPWWLKGALLAPALAINAILFVVVNAIMVNLGAGNQHLSSADGGFEPWIIWPIAAIGLFLFAGIAGLVYIGVGLGADQDLDDEDEHEGETGLLEV